MKGSSFVVRLAAAPKRVPSSRFVVITINYCPKHIKNSKPGSSPNVDKVTL